jgi:hypothetical protein
MKKVLTLSAVVCALGVTWAVAAPSTPQDAQTAQGHTHQGMGGKHGGMQGMMQKHGSKEGYEHGKAEMQGKEMMACDMSAHGAGQRGHQHSTPAK